ncbi:hypothetical protein [Thermodesulforhabdus norvegica]|uniref:Biotin-protein ligase N-terminal domain-containing protein n=1 Tax=Thermodesulforhabdus norvegica TaxID=39841 RepID=A0A1I4VRA9_9BACT|nr:hypothetical protein [Thermodesulforhabdus norvegica]SFN03673.1 hypothetical protein SAMN05660836_02414 [Thermodesulforhabdus norvegica]
MHRVALFWDQSFLWGMFLYDALCEMDIPFCVVRTAQVHGGILSHFPVLLMPGGWASQKVALLGRPGRERIIEFVGNGGVYIGFCGGVGLVLSGKRTLNIVPVKRLPMERRIPSASGPVVIKKNADHPVWDGLPERVIVSIWWPSQVEPDNVTGLTSIALYEKTSPGFWVSDIPYDDVRTLNIRSLEDSYGINLNPEKYLYGKPAIMEYELGEGSFFLSYPHLETPGDVEGRRLLRRIIDHAYRKWQEKSKISAKAPPELPHPPFPSPEIVKKVQAIRRQLEELIDLGIRNLLWFWRKPWLLGWKRGIRGLEYSMMLTLVTFLERALEVLALTRRRTLHNEPVWKDLIDLLASRVDEFSTKARRLLIYERFLSQERVLPKLGSVDPRIDDLRSYLFGSKMNHGGLCKEIFDLIDEALYGALCLLLRYKIKIRFSSRVNDFTIVDA